jgi:two-component system chemotaxis sensor kinase CheA
MRIDNRALLDLFLAESEEQIASLDQTVRSLQERPADQEAATTAYRLIHTLEGSAATLGLGELQCLAHAVKRVLEGIRRGRLAVTGEMVAPLLEAATALRAALARIRDDRPADGADAELRARLDRLADG